MSAANAPAFPSTYEWLNDSDLNTSAPNGEVVPPGGSVALHTEGLTTRQYLAAHAPAIPAWWVDKYLVLKPEATTADLAAEAADWAMAWADAVLERTK